MVTQFLTQTVVFAAAVLLLFYIPGSLLFTASGLNVNGTLSRITLRLAIGLVVTPVIYLVMRRLDLPDLLMLAAILSIVGFWLYRIRSLPRFRWDFEDSIPLIIGILIVGILLGFSHFADYRITEGGAYFRTTPLSESTFHLGLVNAIKDGFPPPAIYAAGSEDFSHYHLNMHLQMEGVHRLTGIDTERLVFWYFPFLYFLLLFLLAYCFVRNQGGSKFAAAAAGALVFGSGFSFLPGMLGLAEPSFAWIQFFHPAVFSIFTLNGVLPALIAMFIVLIAISTAEQPRPASFWLVVGVVTIGSYGLKSSMGLQISAVMLAVGILQLAFEKPSARDWRMAACGAITLAVMITDQELLRGGLGKAFVEIRPWVSLDLMLAQIGMEDVRNISKLVLFGLIFALALGVRLLGLLTVKESLRQSPDIRWLAAFLLIFLLTGWVMPEIIYLGDSSYSFNHSVWFAIQGLFASWFLLFLFLARQDTDRWQNKLLISVLVLLALPSTAQLLWLKAGSSTAFVGQSEHEVVEYLRTTKARSVVLHPLNQNMPSLASNLAGRSSVLNVHLSFVNETQGLKQRAIGTLSFFDPETDRDTRTAIMNFYGVTHVYAPRSMDDSLKKSQDLEMVFGNDDYTVWAVRY